MKMKMINTHREVSTGRKKWKKIKINVKTVM